MQQGQQCSDDMSLLCIATQDDFSTVLLTSLSVVLSVPFHMVVVLSVPYRMGSGVSVGTEVSVGSALSGILAPSVPYHMVSEVSVASVVPVVSVVSVGSADVD